MVVVELKGENSGFGRFSLGFAVKVTFVFMESFADVSIVDSVLLIDVVKECCDVCHCAGRLDRIGEFHVGIVVGYTAMKIFSG